MLYLSRIACCLCLIGVLTAAAEDTRPKPFDFPVAPAIDSGASTDPRPLGAPVTPGTAGAQVTPEAFASPGAPGALTPDAEVLPSVSDAREGDPGAKAKAAAARHAALLAAAETTWTDRATSLPRLGQSLTIGRLAPRPIGADYRLKPGDRVRVVTWGGTARNEVVPVDLGGNLGIPGFGAVPVGGKSVAEAQAALTELVRSHFKQAGVLLGVEQPGVVAVTVVGEVTKPGYHSVPAGASLLDALAVAGGVTAQGTLRAIVVRDPVSAPADPAAVETATVDLYRIAVAGDVAALAPLSSGSVVFVPLRGPEVQVFGAVRRSAAVECRPGDSLADAVALAGGLAADADPDVMRLLREGDEGQVLAQVAAADLAAHPVADGDRLLVIRRAKLDQRRDAFRIEGRVRSPGAYAWSPDLTVGDAVRLAGGPLPDAHVAVALIRRQRAEPQAVAVGSGVMVPSLHELIGPVTASTLLEPLDHLVIPAHVPLTDSDFIITVSGAIDRPGKQPFTKGMTVRQALLLAGGLRADAQSDSADLVRVDLAPDGSREVSRIALDLRAILGGEPGPILQPRDEVVVRQRNDQRLSVTLRGAVSNSGSFTVAQGVTISEVVTLAGGLTRDAFPEGIRLYRTAEVAAATEYIERLKQQLEAAVAVNQRSLISGTGGDPNDVQALQITIAQQEAEIARLANARATGRLLGIDFTGLLAGRDDADVVVQDGDVIEIPIRPGTLRIYGEVMNAGSLRFEPHLRVPTLIARSGGYTQQADRRRVFVVRADGAVVATAAGRGLAWDGAKRGWITTTLNAIELQEGDTIIVPPDLSFKPSKMAIAKDLTQILFQIAVAAATVVAIAP